MLRSTPEWEQFERDCIRHEPKGWHANIGAFEELVELAEVMGQLPPADRLEGIEDDIRLVKALNVRLKSHSADGPDRQGLERRA